MIKQIFFIHRDRVEHVKEKYKDQTKLIDMQVTMDMMMT